MAISTQGVTLKWGTSATSLSKVVDIKDFPDLGGAPEVLETTTLSDQIQTYIMGIQGSGMMEFTANYTKADFQAVVADANKDLYYALDFGTEGTFEWRGQHNAWVVGAGVNAVTEFKIGIAPSTKPKLKTTSSSSSGNDSNGSSS
jgi:hypothetical protein